MKPRCAQGPTKSRALADELDARFEGGHRGNRRQAHALAYAPEIAQVMLRRQQAEAVVSARTHRARAVSMVEAALKGCRSAVWCTWTMNAKPPW